MRRKELKGWHHCDEGLCARYSYVDGDGDVDVGEEIS